MKLRILALTALLVGGFLILTSQTHWGQREVLSRIADTGRLWTGPDVTHSAGFTSDEQNNIDIYKTAHLATVNITSTVFQRDWFMQEYPATASGSGFFIDVEGRILTNNHVIADASRLDVTLGDHTKYKARILARDQTNDLALLQVIPKKKPVFLRLGDSETIQVGQKVLAIGNPYGLEGTLTTGVVSSLGRTIRGEKNEILEGLVQTDAAINRGNSGGPLLDSRGSVIGINTAILGPTGNNIGIGFAMPINRAKALVDDFHAGKSVERPRLGGVVIYLAGDVAEALNLPSAGGLLIQEVAPGGAAERAGLRGGRREVQVGNQVILYGGDFILAIDGNAVDRGDAMTRALTRKRPGDSVTVTIFRGGRKMDVKVTLGTPGDERT